MLVGDKKDEEVRDGVKELTEVDVMDPYKLGVRELYGDHVFIEVVLALTEAVAVILELTEVVEEIVCENVIFVDAVWDTLVIVVAVILDDLVRVGDAERVLDEIAVADEFGDDVEDFDKRPVALFVLEPNCEVETVAVAEVVFAPVILREPLELPDDVFELDIDPVPVVVLIRVLVNKGDGVCETEALVVLEARIVAVSDGVAVDVLEPGAENVAVGDDELVFDCFAEAVDVTVLAMVLVELGEAVTVLDIAELYEIWGELELDLLPIVERVEVLVDVAVLVDIVEIVDK